MQSTERKLNDAESMPAIALQVPLANGAVSFTIPLTISISLGSLSGSVTPLAPFVSSSPPVDGNLTVSEAEALTEAVERFSLTSLAATEFSWPAALSLAMASRLAYSSPEEVNATARNSWGFTSCQFISEGDTQCFVASTSAVLLIAFRGTESLGDWLADLNARSITRSYGRVHRGFYHAFQDVEPQLLAAIGDIGNRSLVMTGHSLGGALATVAAAELNGRLAPSAIYTYGQPRCGDAAFQAEMSQNYTGKFFRFVNDDAIVTRVPPGYRHIGRLFHFDRDGNLQASTESAFAVNQTLESPPLSEAEFDQLRAELLATRSGNQLGAMTETPVATPALEGLFPSFRDHRLTGYITKILRHID